MVHRASPFRLQARQVHVNGAASIPHFRNWQALRDWLEGFGIDVKPTPATHALWTQLKAGECLRRSM